MKQILLTLDAKHNDKLDIEDGKAYRIWKEYDITEQRWKIVLVYD